MSLTPIDDDKFSTHLYDYWEVPFNWTSEAMEYAAPPTTNMPAWLALWWMQEKGQTVTDKLNREWKWKSQHPKVRMPHEETGKMMWFDNNNFWLCGPFALKEES